MSSIRCRRARAVAAKLGVAAHAEVAAVVGPRRRRRARREAESARGGAADVRSGRGARTPCFFRSRPARRSRSSARVSRANAAIVRAMPNTPAAIGKGMTALVANPAVSSAQRALCGELARGRRRRRVARRRAPHGCGHRDLGQRAGLCVPADRVPRASRRRAGSRRGAGEAAGALRPWRAPASTRLRPARRQRSSADA